MPSENTSLESESDIERLLMRSDDLDADTSSDIRLDDMQRGIGYIAPQGRDWLDIRIVRQTEPRQVRQEYFGGIDAKELMKLYAQEPNTICYIGRSPRFKKTGDKSGIRTTSLITIDVDPIRPKGAPSTSQELNEAIREAEIIAERIEGFFEAKVDALMTGNGVQVWVPLSEIVDVRGRRAWWEGIVHEFEREVTMNYVASHKVKIDPQYDLARMCKLPGTLSCKGTPSEDRPWRYSQWLTYDTIDPSLYLDVDMLIERYDREKDGDGDKTFQRATIPSRFWELLKGDQKLADTWAGNRPDIVDTSGSGLDMALVSRLKILGFSPEESKSIMSMSPVGKSRYTDKYADLTLRKVYG